MSLKQKEIERDEKFQKEEAKKKWKMAKYRPPMDFARAKLVLGINPALELPTLELEEIHKRFVLKNAMVRKTSKSRIKILSKPRLNSNQEP